MAGCEVGDCFLDGGLKLLKSGMVTPIDGRPLDELPKPFDEVQVRRVGGQEQQRDFQLRRQRLHRGVTLVASVVQHQRDRSGQTEGSDLPQQLAHRFRVDDRGVGHAYQFAGHGVPGSQDIEPLAARGGPHEDSRERPQAAQERPVHKVGRIDEEDVSPPSGGGVEAGLQFDVVKQGLLGDMLGQVFLGGTGSARTRCHLSPMSFRNLRVCDSPRRRPVSW